MDGDERSENRNREIDEERPDELPHVLSHHGADGCDEKHREDMRAPRPIMKR